jgi:DNA-binding Lrp family transcriptional regulator
MPSSDGMYTVTRELHDRRSGEIIGYTVVLRADAVDQRIRGIMLVEIEGHAADRVIRALGGLPEVSNIHTTNGRWDLVVELGTASLPHFDAVLRRIRLIAGKMGSETCLLLATPRTSDLAVVGCQRQRIWQVLLLRIASPVR